MFIEARNVSNSTQCLAETRLRLSALLLRTSEHPTF